MKIILKIKCLYCKYRITELFDKAVIHTCTKHQKIVDVIDLCSDFKGDKMDKEKIKQIISDYDTLREKIIDIVCAKSGFKKDWEMYSEIFVDEGGIWITIYDNENYDHDFFLNCEEIK